MCTYKKPTKCSKLIHIYFSKKLIFVKYVALLPILLTVLYYFYCIEADLKSSTSLRDSLPYQIRTVLTVITFHIFHPLLLHSHSPATWGQNYSVLINWTSEVVVKNCVHFLYNWKNLSMVGRSHGIVLTHHWFFILICLYVFVYIYVTHDTFKCLWNSHC